MKKVKFITMLLLALSLSTSSFAGGATGSWKPKSGFWSTVKSIWDNVVFYAGQLPTP